MHPIDVPFDGVDFAVVADVAIRVGQRPGGESIGGEALVHQADRADTVRVRQFAVKVGDLGRQQQTFVNDGAGRERGDVEEALVADLFRVGHFRLGALHHDVQLAFELVLGHAAGLADEDLFDIRLGGTGDASDGVAVHGGITPAEYSEPFLDRDALQNAFAGEPLLPFHRQKYHAYAVLAFRR